MSIDPRLAIARRKVQAIKGFTVHAAVFVAVMAVLVAIDFVTGTGWWVQWPLLGWGIGVIAHALAVYGWPRGRRVFSRSWEQRKTEDELKKLRT